MGNLVFASFADSRNKLLVLNIAERKKLNNISEYIVHMYHTEDLIRAYQFNLEDIDKYVISHLPVDEEEKRRSQVWYAEVADNMKAQGLSQNGHLEETQIIIDQLTSIHRELKKTNEDYKKVYKKASKNIEKNMNLSNGKITNPIQICLNGIYGLLLLRMNGKKVDDETMALLETFGDVLSFLSFKYQQEHIMRKN